MSDPASIRRAFERSRKALLLKPHLGQGTGVTRVTVRNGTTCDVESGQWKLVADVGTPAGGNDAGPGPGVLERAALGSCLAIGYATWAAVLGVPMENIEVVVESDYDYRGQFGIDGHRPGYRAVRYRVLVTSSAPEEDVMRVLDEADAHSPVLDDLIRPMSVEREVQVLKGESDGNAC